MKKIPWFVDGAFRKPFVEDCVESYPFEAFIEVFVEIPNVSVKITFTEASFASFVEALVGDFLKGISMEFFAKDFVEVTFM